MAVSQTTIFTQFPWIGGLNTNQDPALVPANQLVTANNCIFGERGSRKMRPGIDYDWDSAVSAHTITVTASSSLADEATDVITITGHGFSSNDPVLYSTTGTVIGGLTSGTTYFVVTATTDTFQVSLTSGGAAINLTSDGVGEQTFTFNPTRSAASSAGLVTEGTDTINLTNHAFSNGTAVLYTVSSGGTAIGGLTSGLVYYVVSATTNVSFKLARTRSGAAIDLTDDGVGTHTFSTSISLVGGVEYSYGTATKSTLFVTQAADGTLYSYTNAGVRTTLTQPGQTIASSAGLVTEAADEINITAHGFSSGDYLYYYNLTGGSDIGGISSGSRYYVVSAAADKFSLSLTSGGAAINLLDDGSGTHYFGTGILTGSSLISQNSFCVLGNNLIICSNRGIPPRKWVNGTGNVTNLKGAPPKSAYCRTHLGRVWMLDPDRLDRLHYSSVGNPEEWGGYGDSGAIDIGTQDGDKSGITAFFSFKSELFVLKRTKLYRVSGFYPEEFRVELISNGIGCVAFNSVVYLDQDDVYWMSDRGIHSLAATANFGDFEGKFISKDIQKSFNEDFNRGSLPNVWGVYLPTINSVIYALTESGDSSNNTLWLYNIPLDSWYRWPTVSSVCMFTATDSDKLRFYVGTLTGRLGQALTENIYDISVDSVHTAISYDIKTGTIYPDGDPTQIKGFKRFGLIYKKDQTHSVTATLRVDNYASQSYTFSDTVATDLLGTTFILGISSLGFSGVLAAYSLTINGWGRGISVELEQSSATQNIEIQGFFIEWEPGEFTQEVIE